MARNYRVWSKRLYWDYPSWDQAAAQGKALLAIGIAPDIEELGECDAQRAARVTRELSEAQRLLAEADKQIDALRARAKRKAKKAK